MADQNHTVKAKDYGHVNISDEVIGIITSIAASEIEGVEGLSGGFTDNVAEIFGKKNLQKGVQVVLENETVAVDLNIIVDYGIKIPEIAWQVQEGVKRAIETMTGLKVREVNIHVQGINVAKKGEDKKD